MITSQSRLRVERLPHWTVYETQREDPKKTRIIKSGEHSRASSEHQSSCWLANFLKTPSKMALSLFAYIGQKNDLHKRYWLFVFNCRSHPSSSQGVLDVCKNTHMTTNTPRPIPFFHHRAIITLESPLLKRVQQGIKVPPTINSNEKIARVGVCACADSCLLTRFVIDRHSINIHQIHPRPGITRFSLSN